MAENEEIAGFEKKKNSIASWVDQDLWCKWLSEALPFGQKSDNFGWREIIDGSAKNGL